MKLNIGEFYQFYKLGVTELGVEFVPIDQLYSEADFIVLTCAATEQNRGMINKSALSKMKKNVVLVNTSRLFNIACFYTWNRNVVLT